LESLDITTFIAYVRWDYDEHLSGKIMKYEKAKNFSKKIFFLEE